MGGQWKTETRKLTGKAIVDHYIYLIHCYSTWKDCAVQEQGSCAGRKFFLLLLKASYKSDIFAKLTAQFCALLLKSKLYCMQQGLLFHGVHRIAA